MKPIALLVFAGATALVVPPETGPSATEEEAPKATVTVCPQTEPSPQPVTQVEFPQASGLEFDPHAPGGARPTTSYEVPRAGVDPTTVTLYPPTQPSSDTRTTTENTDEDDALCP